MASKSSQTSRYRKGQNIQVGDKIAVGWTGTKATEFSQVVSAQPIDPFLIGQRGGKQFFQVKLANGQTHNTTAHSYLEGQYA